MPCVDVSSFGLMKTKHLLDQLTSLSLCSLSMQLMHRSDPILSDEYLSAAKQGSNIFIFFEK